jgi:hypothetical protein
MDPSGRWLYESLDPGPPTKDEPKIQDVNLMERPVHEVFRGWPVAILRRDDEHFASSVQLHVVTKMQRKA